MIVPCGRRGEMPVDLPKIEAASLPQSFRRVTSKTIIRYGCGLDKRSKFFGDEPLRIKDSRGVVE